MKKVKVRYQFFMILFVLVSGMVKPDIIKAEDAAVTFGSNYYRAEDNETFPIGIYIAGDSRIGTYHVEVKYDNTRLAYIGGGDSEEGGIITLEGTGLREQVKYMLKFQTLSGGTAEVEIVNASIQTADGELSEDFDVKKLGSAPVYIEGEDTAALNGEQQEDSETGEDGEASFETGIPLLGQVKLSDGNYYIVNLLQYLPEEIDWNYEKVPGEYQGLHVTWLTNEASCVQFLYLMDEQKKFYLYAYSEEKNQLYPCNTITVSGSKYYFMSPYASGAWPKDLTLDIIQSESIVYAMDLAGNCNFYRIGTGNRLLEWDAGEGEASVYEQTAKLLMILAVTVIIMTLAVGFAVYLDREKKRRKRGRNESPELNDDFIEDLSLDVTEEEILAWRKEAQEIAEKGKPEIAVQNVTMNFRVAMNNVSGIKEYVIQLLKKQISYRELLALNHVSFNIYKGEVVGVIGTNGSGKSTLLKIVSGALKPTGGTVVVDRKKVQLLTLGTGFDIELTAKENVYLNGAIIGYTKEFIDEKYDEIVQFAELEGFMEEKVKNFSSGMVQRLGFAIATVGDAAEILILDEVLSVGDEFFKKKSLKRVKEMIHGGSTVLIVSHSAGTIVENCTKAVWIEKGLLKMVGDPKAVCAAYQGHGQAVDN